MQRKDKLVYIAIAISSIIIIVASVLSISGIDLIPGLIPLFMLIVMLGLGFIMKAQYDAGKISKGYWRFFFCVIVIGIIADMAAGVAQVIDFFSRGS